MGVSKNVSYKLDEANTHSDADSVNTATTPLSAAREPLARLFTVIEP